MKIKTWLAAVGIAAAAWTPLPAAELLAGWASVSITPDRPVALSGHFHTRISKFVHDPVTATALALDNGSHQAVMVSVDVTSMKDVLTKAVRARLKTALPEFDGTRLVLNATHTHTAPDLSGRYKIPAGVMTGAEYFEFLADRIAEAAMKAWKARRPAGVSWALGHAVVGYNRRAAFADGRSVMYAKIDQSGFLGLEGYEDHAAELFFFWTPERKLTGIGVNLACPSQANENAPYISADFWHDTRVELRRRYGHELYVFPMVSAAGDQSPHVQIRKETETRMRQRLGISETAQIARRIAHAVEEVFPAAAADIRMAAPFVHRVEELRLPVRKVTPAELEAAKAEYARYEKGTDPKRHVVMQRMLDVIQRYREQETVTEFPMELHVIRLGEIALATNPFELFLDFGLRMKARSRAEQTFVIQLACDAGRYLPTAKAVAGGGYGAEIVSNRVGPEGGQMLVDRTVAAIHSLFEDTEGVKR